MLREIERFTGQRMTAAKVPTRADVAARRLALFKERVIRTLVEEDLELYLSLVETLVEETGRDAAEIAAATACLAQGERPLLVPLEPEPAQVPQSEDGMVRLFIAAGRASGVRPADIVGAIANEANVPGKRIGAIDIYDDFTFVDVPTEFYEQVLAGMAGATIRGREANVRLATTRDAAAERPGRRPERGPKADQAREDGPPRRPRWKAGKPVAGRKPRWKKK
jgi:ATP-dependent RNA helicase DeaD